MFAWTAMQRYRYTRLGRFYKAARVLVICIAVVIAFIAVIVLVKILVAKLERQYTSERNWRTPEKL